MSPLPRLASGDRILDAVLVVACGILQALALAFAAFATRDAFAALHGGTTLATETIFQLLIAAVVAAICVIVSGYRAEALGQSYATSLRRALYLEIARLPKSRHEERRVGALSLRFVGDLSAARLWFGQGLPEIISAAVVLPGAVLILYLLNPSLANTVVATLGFTLLVMFGVAWQLGRLHHTLRRRRASIAISMIERIAIAPELDLLGRTGRELTRLDQQGAALRRDAMSRRGRTASLQAALQLGVAVSGLIVLWQAALAGIAPATVAASLAVLALTALPLQKLVGAWDHYCAWRIARAKAERLFKEPTVLRTGKPQSREVGIQVAGRLGETPVYFNAEPATTSRIECPNAVAVARCIAGLDRHEGIDIRFSGAGADPKIAFVGDEHIGLQGSLRRSATLMCSKRPSDRKISNVMKEFGLGDMLESAGGLDQRIAENGNGLTPRQTLCLDLVRTVLGKADVIVIASIRWALHPAQHDEWLEKLHQLSSATVVLAIEPNSNRLTENSKVI